jgi:hypothetical protein
MVQGKDSTWRTIGLTELNEEEHKLAFRPVADPPKDVRGVPLLLPSGKRRPELINYLNNRANPSSNTALELITVAPLPN